jgi:hypothetical protein
MKGSFSGSLDPEVKSATSKLDTECCRSQVVSFRNGATRHRTREKYGPGEREIARGGHACSGNEQQESQLLRARSRVPAR